MENGKILASVKGSPITEKDVDEMVMALSQRGQSYDNPQGREMVLEQIINKKLLLIDAQQNLYEYDEEFKKQMEQVKEEILMNFAVKKAVEKIVVSDEDAKKYYDENKEQFVSGNTVSASHILVAEEEKAKELLAKIQGGEISFEDAARQNSTCPSAENGGSLGEFTKGQMVPEFDDACFSMEVGEIKGPVKTQFGYHLIKLTDKKKSESMEFEQVKEQLKQNLLNEQQQTAYKSKLNQLRILYPVDRF